MSELKIIKMEDGYLVLHEEIATAQLGEEELKVLRSLHDNTLFYRFPEGTFAVTLHAITDVVVEHRERELKEGEAA